MRHALFILVLFCQPLKAGMNIEDLLPPPSHIQSDEARERVQQQIEADRQAEQKRNRLESQAREEARRQWETSRAQRPFRERLVEQRCLSCHTPELMQYQARTALHWGLVIQRMKWFNGADIPLKETPMIAQYLATQTPVSPSRKWLEWGVIISLLILIVWVVGSRLKRKKEKYES